VENETETKKYFTTEITLDLVSAIRCLSFACNA